MKNNLHLFLFIFLLCSIFVMAEDNQIQTIFDETKKELGIINNDKNLTPEEKAKKLTLCKKKNLSRLEELKSFYINRMKFEESKQVKEAIARFEKEDFLGKDVAKGPAEKETQKPKENLSKDIEKKSNEKTTDDNKDKDNGGASYLDRKKAGLTAREFAELPQDKKEIYIKKYVTRDADGFYTVNKSRYTVKTDISEEYALQKAIFMDDFYISFERLFCRGFANTTSPTLYITKTRYGYFDVLKRKGVDAPSWSGGLYYSSKKILAGYEEAGGELMKVLLHEGTHQLMDYYTNRDLLPWFNEGIATNFETWDIYKSPRINVFECQFKSEWLSHVAKHHKKTKYTLGDFKFLLNLSYEKWNDSIDPSDYYAQGWSMVNFLMNTEDNFKIFDKILVGFMQSKKIDRILTDKEIETLGNQWVADVENRIVPMHTHGKQVYEAINKWVESKKYDQSGMKNHVYELEKLRSVQVVELNYLMAMHKMITGDIKNALNELVVLVKQNDDLPYIYSALAYCQVKQNELDEAKKNIIFALQKNGNDILAKSLQ